MWSSGVVTRLTMQEDRDRVPSEIVVASQEGLVRADGQQHQLLKK